jgi:hypothetical protein
LERIREIAAALWRRYRELRAWAQVVIGVVVVSIIVGPFLGDSEKSPGVAASTTTERETTTTEPTTTATEATTTTKPEVGLSGFSECLDASGDGAGGDLASARLATEGEVLTVGYETAAPLNGPSFSYYINIFSAGYQIGLRSIDGEVTRFVFDLNETQQENLTSAYTLDGTVATLAVPLSALPRLEQPFDYTAVITVDGQDADECAGTFSGSE